MTEKSVVIVVVEGYSDMVSVGTILKEYFNSAETQFVITRGDITSRNDVNAANVIKKLKDEIEKLRSRYGYRWKDFVRIIHIADTDGAFTEDCVVEANVGSIKYYEDHMEFIDFISGSDVAAPGTYRETWSFIEKDKHSLQRHTNMHLIF